MADASSNTEAPPSVAAAASAGAQIDNSPDSIDESKIANLSLAERLEQKVEGYAAWPRTRPRVNSHIVRAYELHKTAIDLQEIMTREEQTLQTNPLLKSMLERDYEKIMSEKSSILDVPTEVLYRFEQRLVDLVKYRCKYFHEKNQVSLRHNKQLDAFLQGQRGKIFASETDVRYLNNVPERIGLLERLDICTVRRQFRSFDDRIEDLREYKKKNGHLKVPRLYKGEGGLGEWLHKLRREYKDYEDGKKVSRLTVERVAELDAIGMVWKLRSARPKKGDERFRLQRKNPKYTKKKSATDSIPAEEKKAKDD